MLIRFQIEAAIQQSGMPIVFAKKLDPGDFELHDGASLGGVAIQAKVSMPRAHNQDGSPRFDLFAFQLCSQTDLGNFTIGKVVTLDPAQHA